ncbi:MAG: thioredoxin family protein [Phycisphaerae bacterium]|nr:thioredoxin family protein [Phycisphaerae bacterium]
MRSIWRPLIAAVAIGAVVAAVVLRRRVEVAPAPTDGAKVVTDGSTPRVPLPCLVEFSAGDCGPCKTMEPILDGLARDYQGRFRIETIDIWKRPSAGEEHNIRMYPTQIFYDAMGNELFRHEGFFSREDILAKWKDLGQDFESP